MSLTSDPVSQPSSPGGVAALGDMPVEELRRHAHRTIDAVVDYLAELERLPVLAAVQPGDVRRLLPLAAPERGEPMEDILADVESVVLPGITHWGHPGFFAYFNSSASAPGLLGELLATAFNVNAMLWKTSPAATELEQVAAAWVGRLLGLPPEHHGVIHEGGSTSNLCALAAAREAALGPALRELGMAGAGRRLRLYASTQTHSSVDKAAVTLGLGLAAIRRVETDERYRLSVAALRRALAEDRAAGWQPFCVVANLGSTSCTAVDPIGEIATLCGEQGLWLHVDAAQGGPLAMLDEKRPLFDGWEGADSITINPHKWMFVPLDCSLLFTRRPQVLRRAFGLLPEYLRTERSGEVEDLMDYGVSLGRRFRALKLWMVLRWFGREGLTARLREHLRLAALFAGWVDEHPGFERLAPVPMSTVCFRATPPGLDEESLERHNVDLMNAVNASGEVYLSHTRLGARLALRLSVSGLRSEERHLRRAWQLLQEPPSRTAAGADTG